MRKWIRRILYVFLTLLVLALLGGFTYEQVGRARDASQLPPRVGQAVDMGGRTLNLYCSGQGTPTVILETAKGNGPPAMYYPAKNAIIAGYQIAGRSVHMMYNMMYHRGCVDLL